MFIVIIYINKEAGYFLFGQPAMVKFPNLKYKVSLHKLNFPEIPVCTIKLYDIMFHGNRSYYSNKSTMMMMIMTMTTTTMTMMTMMMMMMMMKTVQ